MVPPIEFTLDIDAYSPETIPMERLAAYLLEWATLMGETQSVHFLKVKRGSVRPVACVAWEAAPKVRRRIAEARANEGPHEARVAKRRIDQMLVEDNASATLWEARTKAKPAKVLYFPGAKASTASDYGPFQQAGTLTGVPIVIGGENDPVPVHLQDRDAVHNCRASRDIAKELAPYLFTTPIRVTGVGTWIRSKDGAWEMRRFLIQSIAPVRQESVIDATTRLQGLGGRIHTLRDPIRDLRSIQADDPRPSKKSQKR